MIGRVEALLTHDFSAGALVHIRPTHPAADFAKCLSWPWTMFRPVDHVLENEGSWQHRLSECGKMTYASVDLAIWGTLDTVHPLTWAHG